MKEVLIPNGPKTSALRWFALAILLVFIAHLPFALFSNEFQDGWIHALLYEQSAYEEIFKRLMENGRPVAGWLNLHAMTATGFAHGAIWLSVLGAVIAGAAWYATFLRTGVISPKLACVMAVLSAVTPANQIILSTPTVIFVSAHAFFALGIWLFLEAHLRATSILGKAAYVVSCAFGALSALLGEATAPMLLLYPMVIFLVDGTFAKGKAINWTRTSLTLIKRSTPVILGVGAFAAMFVIFPPVGAEMVSERRISFQPVQLALSLGTFLSTVLLAYLPFWFAIAWMQTRRVPAKNIHQNEDSYRSLLFLLMALSTAVLSLSPYIAALRLASPAGWGLRYLYYFGSALAWLLAGLAGARDNSDRVSIDNRWAAWLTIAVLSGLLLRWPFFAVRTVHENMVALAVSDSSVARQSRLFVMDDPTNVMAAPLRDAEWTGLLQRVLHAPFRLAAVASPLEPESAWTRWRYKLRQRMGWAPAVQPALTSDWLREQLRKLRVLALVGELNGACAVTEVRVAEPPAFWSGQALIWYLRSIWQPAAYASWLKTEADARISIKTLPFLDLCR